MLIILSFSLAIVLLAMIVFLRRQHVSLFDLGFLFVCVYTVAYLIKPIFILLNPNDFITFKDFYPASDNYSFLLMYVLALIGLLAFVIGYYSDVYKKLRLAVGCDNCNYKALIYISTMGIFLGFSILLYLFITLSIANGEVAAFILFNPDTRTIFMQGFKGNGHLFFFITNMPLLLFIRTWSAIQYAKKFSRTRTQKLIDAFIVIFVLGSMALIGGRLQLLGAVIGLISIYHYSRQKISLKSQFFATLLLVTSAGVLGVLLQTDFYLSNEQLDFFSPYRLLIRIYESYDAFDTGVIALSKFDQFYFGLTIFEDIFLTYIPRAIFPFKPEVFGVVRIQNDILPTLYEYAGLSATYPMGFVAEIYLNFGLPGLIVLPFLFGVFFKTLQNNALASGLYLCIVAFTLSLMPMVVRSFGSFLSAIIFSLIFLKVIFIFSKFRLH